MLWDLEFLNLFSRGTECPNCSSRVAHVALIYFEPVLWIS